MIIVDPSLTIEDAKHLMEVLDNDIPTRDKKNIAFLLLILASNPDLAENSSPVGCSARTYHNSPAVGAWKNSDYGYGYDY